MINMFVNWSDIKNFVDDRSISIQWLDIGNIYYIYAIDGVFCLSSEIKKDGCLDQYDFESNYKSEGNQKLSIRNKDGREILHTTPRKIGTFTYFSSADDDHSDAHAVGGDANIAELYDNRQQGDSNPKIIYLDFNCIDNETHLRDGGIEYKDALNDLITVSITPKLTSYSAGTNTYYNLYAGFLIIPAAGDGLISINDNDRVLVQCVPNEFGNKQAGYWNATWNTTTKQFENISPAVNGDGDYNMFGAEYVFHRFINKVRILGDGFRSFDTMDISQIGHNMRIKATVKSETDRSWHWNAWLQLYRKKTV